MLNVGIQAPDFTVPDQDDQAVSLQDYRGKWLVLYFYPKDNTSGCTTEACEFTELLPDFGGVGAEVLGVSPDSTKAHRNFIEKHDLKIRLLSDPEHQVLEPYGAWALKKNYGREYMGVVRSTYIIDPEGKIAHVWKSVKAKGHAEKVKEKLLALKG